MGRYETVDFEHNDLRIRARVYLGSTTGRGDDYDDVVSLNVEGRPYLTKGEQIVYEELAIEYAKGYR